MIDPHDLSLFRFVETAEQAWELIQAHYAQEAAPAEAEDA
mgnify:FL=1